MSTKPAGRAEGPGSRPSDPPTGRVVGPLSSPADAIRGALTAHAKKANKEAVGAAILAGLVSLGLKPAEAAQALRAIGYRPGFTRRRREHLLALCDAYLVGMPNGMRKKQIWAEFAELWAVESGQPDYDADNFRKTHAAWKAREDATAQREATRIRLRKMNARAAMAAGG